MTKCVAKPILNNWIHRISHYCIYISKTKLQRHMTDNPPLHMIVSLHMIIVTLHLIVFLHMTDNCPLLPSTSTDKQALYFKFTRTRSMV
jgi:hypothetical protein